MMPSKLEKACLRYIAAIRRHSAATRTARRLQVEHEAAKIEKGNADTELLSARTDWEIEVGRQVSETAPLSLADGGGVLLQGMN